MTVEYSISVFVILFIVAFCICFMLRFHNIAILHGKNIEKPPSKATKVIRVTDAILDTLDE